MRTSSGSSVTCTVGVAGTRDVTNGKSATFKTVDVDAGAERVYNFLHTLTLEVQMLARACGKTDVHSLEPEDLCALTMEAAAMAKVPLAGTTYIPGVSEERALERIERLLERTLENPVDELPVAPEVAR